MSGQWIEEVEKWMIRTFDIQSTWESDAIATPTSTAGGKVVGLSSTGGPIRKSKVIATTNEIGLGGASVLGGEVRILVAWDGTSALRAMGVPSYLPVPSVALM